MVLAVANSSIRNSARQLEGSDPLNSAGNICDSAHLQLIIATRETNDRCNPSRMSRVIREPKLGVSHFSDDKAADCAKQ